MKFDPLYHMKKVESDFSRIRETKELLHAKERAAAAQMMSVCASFFPNDIKTPQVSGLIGHFNSSYVRAKFHVWEPARISHVLNSLVPLKIPL